MERNVSLDVTIPTHNEAGVIVPTLRIVSTVLTHIPGLDWRIIIADNGSTDGTADIVEGAELPHVEVLRVKGRGKGLALKAAAEYSTADFFAFLDADLSASPESLATLLARVKDGGVHLAIGSRFHPETSIDRGHLRNASSRAFNLLARLLVGIRVNDTQCPLKVMDKKGKHALLSSIENTWFLDLELVARAQRSGLVVEVHPVVWTEFRYPSRKSKLHVVADGLRAVRAMHNIRKRIHHGT